MVREVDGTMAHTVLGTPQYMAPEVSQSLPYDFSADIWSMGVIFYEMITLKFKIMHYVRAMEEKDIYYERIKEDILEVDSQYKEVVEVVVSMLNLDPKLRIPLKDALKHLESMSELE
jgi:serine/threonine protein kinase